MSDLEKITLICQRLGAGSGQAATMAAQLLKRAEQIAAERKITKEAALGQLLEILVQGRQGNVPPSFTPPAAGSK